MKYPIRQVQPTLSHPVPLCGRLTRLPLVNLNQGFYHYLDRQKNRWYIDKCEVCVDCKRYRRIP